MARTTSRVNKAAQLNATTAAKRSRIEEAGLRGPRLGPISAAKRKAQARRDAKSDAVAAEAASSAPATRAKGKSAASSDAGAAASKSPAAAGAGKSRRARSAPLIEVRTGNSVKGSARLDAFAEKVVAGALSRFLPRVTRIDVHLSDANAGKAGDDDKHCQIEVRPASDQPVSATATAGTIEKALTGAANKMKRLLATRFGRARVRGKA